MYKKLMTLIAAGTLLVGCSSVEEKKVAVVEKEPQEYHLTNKYQNADITIAFDDGKVFGFSGVNRYFGGAVINGEDLDISNVASTMMAGPQDKMAAEMEYLQLLSEADKIKMEDNKVIITTKDNQELIFEAK